MKKPRKPPPQTKTLNPFEVHINKQKMAVLGQRTKNDRGLPGVSRAKALKKRKETLLQEYKLQHKSNKFTDRRIGEKSRDMTAEDKVMARFTAIRKKAHKKSLYNLADDEILTHKGQTLSEIEKFDDPRSDDESLDEGKSGNLESNFVEDAHFGGGILTRTGKEGYKTHRELIDELIAESKKRKAEKQKTKEATLELTEKLDTEWKDLLPLVSKKDKNDEAKASIDDYDKVMRELRFEARGTVSDRLKTEEDIAKEENERLEELEKERQDRMKGFDEEEKKPTHRSADDLDDDFVYESDPEYMLSYNKEGESNVEIDAQINGKDVVEKGDGGESEDEGEEEAEEEEEDSEDSGEDEAESEDDLSDLKADTSEESEEEDATEKESLTKEDENKAISDERRNEVMEKARQELPYTFKIPNTYEDLQKLFEDQSTNHQNVIIERMIKCNHPSLSEKNKENLKVLFAYLLQYLNDCASESSFEKCYEVFSALAPHLFDLTQLDKENAYYSMKEVIKEKHEEYKKRPKNYPGLEVLIFLKLVSLLFPTSDFRHQVVTPCIVFIEQMLLKCRVKTRKDIAYGLFLVTLVLEYTTLSHRYLPASINYLGGILHMAVPKVGVKLIKVNPPFQPTTNLLVLHNNCTNSDYDVKMVASDLMEEKIDDSFKVRALYISLKLIEDFDNNLANLPSNVEIFKDILAYLELLPTRNYPKSLCTQFENTSQQLKNRRNDRRIDYIVMAARRPKALRLYEPKIEEVFDGKRRKVQSREETERDKLIHKLKKETKGALREIRRDKAFLSRVKIQKRIQSDKERRDKVNRIYSEAALQQSELNAMDRKKKRKSM